MPSSHRASSPRIPSALWFLSGGTGPPPKARPFLHKISEWKAAEREAEAYKEARKKAAAKFRKQWPSPSKRKKPSRRRLMALYGPNGAARGAPLREERPRREDHPWGRECRECPCGEHWHVASGAGDDRHERDATRNDGGSNGRGVGTENGGGSGGGGGSGSNGRAGGSGNGGGGGSNGRAGNGGGGGGGGP